MVDSQILDGEPPQKLIDPPIAIMQRKWPVPQTEGLITVTSAVLGHTRLRDLGNCRSLDRQYSFFGAPIDHIK
jgi:hypothetical protein